MSNVGDMRLALELQLPTPTRKLELLLPPLTFSAPPPPIVSFVVIAAERFGLPTTKTLFSVALSPLSGALPVTLRVAPLLIVTVLVAALLLVAHLKLPIDALT